MFMGRMAALVAVAGLGLAGGLFAADDLTLKSGTVLHGDFKGVEGGMVVFKDAVLGEQKLAPADVSAVHLGASRKVYWQSSSTKPIEETTLTGVGGSGDAMTLETSGAGGKLTVPLSGAYRMSGESYSLTKFSGSASASAQWTDGNTRDVSYGLDFRAAYDAPGYRIDGYASAQFASQRGRRSAQRARAGLGYTNRFSEMFGWFVREDVEHDDFANLALRSVTTAGLSAFLMDTDTSKLRVEAGISYTDNDYKRGNADSEYFGASLGLYYSYKISDTASFTASSRANISLENARQTSVHNEAALVQRLWGDFTSSLVAQHDYEGLPATGRKHNDVRFMLLIGWTF
jgi:hypothetical protein